jgi:hypothetical protein
MGKQVRNEIFTLVAAVVIAVTVTTAGPAVAQEFTVDVEIRSGTVETQSGIATIRVRVTCSEPTSNTFLGVAVKQRGPQRQFISGSQSLFDFRCTPSGRTLVLQVVEDIEGPFHPGRAVVTADLRACVEVGDEFVCDSDSTTEVIRLRSA